MWLRQRGALHPPHAKILLVITVSFFPWSLKLYTYPPINEKDKECMELWLCSTSCLHYHTSALVALVFILKLHTCWMLLCLHHEQPVSGSEGGGAVSWCEILKISLHCVWFVHSWGAGHANTAPQLGSNVMSLWGIRCCTKVSFTNKFSFCCFYKAYLESKYRFAVKKIK